MHLEYVAAAQMMWYDGEWQPWAIALSLVGNVQNTCFITPDLNSLVRFSYDDVVKNRYLPNNPFDGVLFYGCLPTVVKIQEMRRYILEQFCETHIGTLDMATYHYLTSILPSEYIHFIGYESIRDCGELLGPELEIVQMVRAAAKKIQ